MWKFRKSTGGVDEGKDRGARGQQRGRNVLIWIERILLVSGVGLVGVFGAARIESFFASRAALEQFAALETPSDITDSGSEADVHPSAQLAPSEPTNLP